MDKERENAVEWKELVEEHGHSLEWWVENNDVVRVAYEFFVLAFDGKERQSGEPYFLHCERVAQNVLSFEVRDENTIAAALLHDVIEDIDGMGERDKLAQMLIGSGINDATANDVANLVDGVSKVRFKDLYDDKVLRDFEVLREVLRLTEGDVRIGILKLADRLDNMRDMESMDRAHQLRKANETWTLAKLAGALGLWRVKQELEDWAFRYSTPEEYEMVQGIYESDPRLSEMFDDEIVGRLSEKLRVEGISFEAQKKVNGIFATYRKMYEKFGYIENVNDLVSVRLILKDMDKFIQIKTLLQELFGRVVEEDDYLGPNKRPNKYEAHHFVFREYGVCFEVALATVTMEEFNNLGVVKLINETPGEPVPSPMKVIFSQRDQKAWFVGLETTWFDWALMLPPGVGMKAVSVMVDGELRALDELVENAAVASVIKDQGQVNWGHEALNLTRQPQSEALVAKINERLERRAWIEDGKEKVREMLADRGLITLEHLEDWIVDEILDDFGCANLDELYLEMSTPYKKEKLNRVLDEWGVAKGISELWDSLGKKWKMGGYMSAEVRGENVEGAMGVVGDLVKSMGGDVRKMYASVKEGNREKGEEYVIELMCYGLVGEEKMLEELLFCLGFVKKVVVV